MKRLLFSALLIPALLRGEEPLRRPPCRRQKVVDNTRFELEYKLKSAYPDFGCVDFGRCMDRPGVAYALTTLRCEKATPKGSSNWDAQAPCGSRSTTPVVYERPCRAPSPRGVRREGLPPSESFRSPPDGRSPLSCREDRMPRRRTPLLMQSRNFSRYASRAAKASARSKPTPRSSREARWLVLGTFEGDLATPLAPDSTLLSARPYRDCGRTLAWNIPPRRYSTRHRPPADASSEWYYQRACNGFRRHGSQCAATPTHGAISRSATFPLAEHQTAAACVRPVVQFRHAGAPMLRLRIGPGRALHHPLHPSPDPPERLPPARPRTGA